MSTFGTASARQSTDLCNAHCFAHLLYWAHLTLAAVFSQSFSALLCSPLSQHFLLFCFLRASSFPLLFSSLQHTLLFSSFPYSLLLHSALREMILLFLYLGAVLSSFLYVAMLFSPLLLSNYVSLRKTCPLPLCSSHDCPLLLFSAPLFSCNSFSFVCFTLLYVFTFLCSDFLYCFLLSCTFRIFTQSSNSSVLIWMAVCSTAVWCLTLS